VVGVASHVRPSYRVFGLFSFPSRAADEVAILLTAAEASESSLVQLLTRYLKY
jgi:hypothetical protein